MSMMVWDASLETGHAKVDSDHKKLVALVNRLGDAMARGQGKDVCGRILTELVSYTRTHFGMEEHLMDMHAYAAAAQHKAEHERLVRDVMAFKEKFDSGTASLSISLLNFLKTWLADHIRGTDKIMVAAIAAKTPA